MKCPAGRKRGPAGAQEELVPQVLPLQMGQLVAENPGQPPGAALLRRQESLSSEKARRRCRWT